MSGAACKPRSMFILACLLAIAAPASHAGLRKCVAPDGKPSYVEGACPSGTSSADLRPGATEPNWYRGPPKDAETTSTRLKDMPSGVTLNYYDVEGADVASLRRSLAERSPPGSYGKTIWNVIYRVKSERARGQCAIASLEVGMSADMLLPRWKGRARASAPLIERWDRFYEALQTHEAGHVESGRELVRVLTEELARVPPAKECRALEQAIQMRYLELREKAFERDRSYDAGTRHGSTQG